MNKTGLIPVNVFISSTFLDMKEEREHLTKLIFPELQERCKNFSVDLKFVDLRWGITEEDISAQQLIPICLNEIDRCRPFFIALIGKRYGTPAGDLAPPLYQTWPWLKNCRNKSPTEIEIIHGALNPGPETNGLFYFRQNQFGEKPFVFDQGIRELKKQITDRGYSPRTYRSVEMLGQMIHSDLYRLIKPISDQQHKTAGYGSFINWHDEISRRWQPNLFSTAESDKVYHAMQESNDSIVVALEHATERTALLASIFWKYYAQAAESFSIAYFASANTFTFNIETMQYYFSIKLDYRGQGKKDGASKELFLGNGQSYVFQGIGGWANVFLEMLQSLDQTKNYLIMLDAIDDMDPLEKPLDILPQTINLPKNIRLVVGIKMNSIASNVAAKGYRLIDLNKPLPPVTIETFSMNFLRSYGKRLTSAQLNRITLTPACSNLIFLRNVLEQLIKISDYLLVDMEIDALLAPIDIVQLYTTIIQKIERLFDIAAPARLRAIFLTIYASNYGISEKRLTELTGPLSNDLNMSHWNAIKRALGDEIIDSSTVIRFANDYFKQAVELYYHPSAEDLQKLHISMASLLIGETDKKSIVDMFCHLFYCRKWEWLQRLLTESYFLEPVWEFDREVVLDCWNNISLHTTSTIPDSFQEIYLGNRNRPISTAVFQLLELSGNKELAMKLKQENGIEDRVYPFSWSNFAYMESTATNVGFDDLENQQLAEMEDAALISKSTPGTYLSRKLQRAIFLCKTCVYQTAVQLLVEIETECLSKIDEAVKLYRGSGKDIYIHFLIASLEEQLNIEYLHENSSRIAFLEKSIAEYYAKST